MLKSINDWQFVIMMSLLLGLAPFFPEPHIVGKLRWVAGGAVGMQLMDWLDLLMHGLPWLLLIRLGIIHVVKLAKPIAAGSKLSKHGVNERRNNHNKS